MHNHLNRGETIKIIPHFWSTWNVRDLNFGWQIFDSIEICVILMTVITALYKRTQQALPHTYTIFLCKFYSQRGCTIYIFKLLPKKKSLSIILEKMSSAEKKEERLTHFFLLTTSFILAPGFSENMFSHTWGILAREISTKRSNFLSFFFLWFHLFQHLIQLKITLLENDLFTDSLNWIEKLECFVAPPPAL